MAFNKKDWTNRASEYPNRRILSIVETASKLETGAEIIVDVTRNEGQISAEGDAFDETNMNDLEERISAGFEECLKSVSDGKTAVAAAITEQGVATDSDASFETMASNVTAAGTARYNAGVTATKKGTATAAQVLKGKTFTNSSSVGLTGTMTDYSANVQTVTPSASQTGTAEFEIPDGYHTKMKVNAANVYNAGKAAGASGKYTVKTGTINNVSGSSSWYRTPISTGLSTVNGFLLSAVRVDDASGSAGSTLSSYSASGGTVTPEIYLSSITYNLYWVAWGN